MVCSNGWIECHPGTASWLQAIGAIVGIGIAIAIPAFQFAAAKRQARKDMAQQFRAVVQIVIIGLRLVGDVVSATKELDAGRSYFNNKFKQSLFNNLLRLLEGVQVGELPTPQAVISFVEAHQCIVDCFEWVAGINYQHANPDGSIDHYIDELRERRDELIARVNELLNECVVVERGREQWSCRIRAVIERK